MGDTKEQILSLLEEVLGKVSKEEIADKMIELFTSKETTNKVNPGDAKKITKDYFNEFLLEMRLMDAVLPSTEFSLYGETFSSPIMTAALSHLKRFHPDIEDPMVAYGRGAAMANCVHWTGMGENDELDAIVSTGAHTIKIIKPYDDEDKVYNQIAHAEKIGAFAVGLDIDHTFTSKGEIDVVFGEKMAIRSSEEIREYIRSTRLPFIIKGVLSVRDAVKCAEIGAKGIVISHHGGQLDYAVPPLMVLPEIAKELGKEIPIFVDCGISTGYDAYKALALGATAVSVGIHLIPYIRKGGAQAVCDRLNAMTEELKGAMAYTGIKDTSSFDPTVLHRKDGKY